MMVAPARGRGLKSGHYQRLFQEGAWIEIVIPVRPLRQSWSPPQGGVDLDGYRSLCLGQNPLPADAGPFPLSGGHR